MDVVTANKLSEGRFFIVVSLILGLIPFLFGLLLLLLWWFGATSRTQLFSGNLAVLMGAPIVFFEFFPMLSFGIIALMGILAIVFGIKALKFAQQGGVGKKMAIFAIVIGCLDLAWPVALVLIAGIPHFTYIPAD